jgi:hypothetical protein
MKRFLDWVFKDRFPHTTEHGVKFAIRGGGIIHVDVKSLVKSEKFKAQVRACRYIKTDF